MSAAVWEDEPPPGRFDDDALPADIAAGDVFGRPDWKSQLAMHERPQDEGAPDLPRLDALIEPAIDRAERRSKGIERPVPLPWSMLAGHFGGGLWPGVHYVISGTGIGKTALALQCALHAARAAIPALYIGLELEPMQIALRVIGEAAGVPWSTLYTGQAGPALIRRARDAVPKVCGLPLHVALARPQGWPSSDLPLLVAAMRAVYPEPDGPGSAPLLVVVDFLQIIGDEPDANGRSLDLRERIGRAAYRSRDVASHFSASVLVVSSAARDKYGQLGRVADEAGLAWDADDRGRPIRRRVLRPDAFVGLGKESGEIEYSGDSVSVLARVPESDVSEGGCDVLFVTAKGRATGATWSPLHFTGHGYREADDGGSFVVAKLKALADRREARREAKVVAKEDAKVARIVSDAVAVASYVLAHPDCPVREARVNAVGDSSRRWTPALAKLGPALRETPSGKAKRLTLDRSALPADVAPLVTVNTTVDRGHSPPLTPPPSTSTVDGLGAYRGPWTAWTVHRVQGGHARRAVVSADHTGPSNPPNVGQAAPTPTEATASGGGGMAGPAEPGSTPPADTPEAPSSTPGPSGARYAPAGSAVAVVVPLALTSGGNRREHPLSRARRTRREHQAILAALADYSPQAFPVVVQLVRVGWNRVDVDGLVSSMKGPIDALARWLGVDDRDLRVHWHLAQSITRERRISRRTGRREVAAELRIVVRRWEPRDGDDPLRVLAVASFGPEPR